MLEQILFYFRQLRIPITPLAVTLFIGALFGDLSNKNIRNEAYLIENYLEKNLEKTNIEKQNINFDFRDKESFLAHIAYRMVEKNKFYWDIMEFAKEKLKYFENLGEFMPEDSVFEEFFLKGILKRENNVVSFKMKAWFNFFLAKMMVKRSKILTEVLNRDDYLSFSTAIGFVAGISRNNIDLLLNIKKRIDKEIGNELKDALEKFQDYKEIESTLFEFGKELEVEILEKNKEEIKDAVKDEKYLNYDPEEQEINPEKEPDDLIELITLCSDIIRNTTEINVNEKSSILSENINYYLWVINTFIELFKSTIGEIGVDLIKEFFSIRKEKDVKPEKINKLVDEFLKIVIPLSLILYMTEHLANPKLEKIVIDLIPKEKNIFKKLFLNSLLLKLDLKEGLEKIGNLITESKSNIVDLLIFQILLVYAHEYKLSEEEANVFLKLLNKIRSKHVKYTKVPRKDTFDSDFRKEVLLN